jgi:hypothetical protein
MTREEARQAAPEFLEQSVACFASKLEAMEFVEQLTELLLRVGEACVTLPSTPKHT